MQCRILNSLSKARDGTCNLMVPSHPFPLRHDGNSASKFLKEGCKLVREAEAVERMLSKQVVSVEVLP